MKSIAWNGYLFTNPDSAFYYAQQLYDFAKQKSLLKFQSAALNTQGASFYVRGNYLQAMDYYQKSLKIFEKLDDDKGKASTYMNIGVIYFEQGDYPQAIDYYTRYLKINEKTGNKVAVAKAYNNIGAVYCEQNNNEQAISYYKKSLKIRDEIGDKKGLAYSYNNIGTIYLEQDNYSKAIDYYLKSLQIKKEIKDKKGEASSYNSLASVFSKKGDYQQAIDYYTKSLLIFKKLGDKKGITVSYNGLADVFYKKGEITKALEKAAKALEIAKDIGAISSIKDAAMYLFKINKKIGNYQEALDMHELYITLRDSINNEESQKEVLRQRFQYNYEKKLATDSVAHAKATELKNIEIAKQQAELTSKKKEQYLLYGGISVLLLFLGFVYNRLQVTRKQKRIIEKQKQLVELSHKEITDSINYAKRIQDAMLASEEHETPHLPEHFVLYKPKDVVSGDFYWVSEKQGCLCVAVVDCTGHGVPGAFMSMLGMSFLNEINSHEKALTPAEILDELRRKIIKELRQTGAEGESKDGMDISLIRINLNNTAQVMWAGANNPLYIISDNELHEIKADKQSIGYGYNMQPFTNHSLNLKKGDLIYLFTDGFADQFGGTNGKKFKYKPFKQLLLKIKDKPMPEQKSILNQAFEEWKGNLEQVDDVCIVGIRL